MRRTFIIGNAFGFSTFLLAHLFPAAPVDAIDPETEGQRGALGANVTRRLAAAHRLPVALHTGYSPQDVLLG